MKIKIIAIGKIKNKDIQNLIDEYLKRLPKNLIEIIEIKDSNKENEGKEILKHLENTSSVFFIPLVIQAKEKSSEEFAHLIKEKLLTNNICFAIGGPEGLSNTVINKANLQLSISNMTFTHELARVLLLEQIYRGFSINKGMEYHK